MDILAWFDHGITSCEQRATQVDDELKFVYLDAARDNREARAAVAELIGREAAQREALEDLREQCQHNLEVGATGPAYWEDALDTIDAALARVGGAA